MRRYKAIRDMPFHLRDVSCLTPAKPVLNMIKKVAQNSVDLQH